MHFKDNGAYKIYLEEDFETMGMEENSFVAVNENSMVGIKS